MEAEILTSRPDSPWSLTSPNLCSTRTDWPAPRETVFWKSRLTSSWPAWVAADVAGGTATKTVTQRNALVAQQRNAATGAERGVSYTGPVIAFPPQSLPACAAFLGTWPAMRSADERSTGFARSAHEYRRWRCRAAAAFRGSWRSTESRNSPVAAWLP